LCTFRPAIRGEGERETIPPSVEGHVPPMGLGTLWPLVLEFPAKTFTTYTIVVSPFR